MPPAVPPSPPWSRGRVVRWNDAEGYGFLAPDAGGADLFFHVGALRAGARRPVPGEAIEFQAGLGADGRPRAIAVRLGRDWLAVPSLPAALALAFLALVATASWTRGLSWWILALYGAASLASGIAYALDKRRAEHGERRIAERTLHVLDLVGGWPGGLVVARALRHKTQKLSFRLVFWATAALHVALWLTILGGLRIWWWL